MTRTELDAPRPAILVAGFYISRTNVTGESGIRIDPTAARLNGHNVISPEQAECLAAELIKAARGIK